MHFSFVHCLDTYTISDYTSFLTSSCTNESLIFSNKHAAQTRTPVNQDQLTADCRSMK